MIPQFPTNTRTTIDAIINQIARDVIFYVVDTLSGCYSCNLDPITNTSQDSYCEVCSGEYWIPTYSSWTVSGHIFWGQEQQGWVTGGQLDVGDCLVKFMHTQAAEDIVHNAEFVIVDGRELDVDKVTLRGVPEINRILVKLKEKEKV